MRESPRERLTVIIGDPVRGSCKRTEFRDVVFNVYVVSHHNRTPYIILYPLIFDLLYTPALLLVLALESLRVTGNGAFQRWREARVFVKAFLLSQENARPYTGLRIWSDLESVNYWRDLLPAARNWAGTIIYYYFISGGRAFQHFPRKVPTLSISQH